MITCVILSVCSVWVRMPYLPLQFWDESCYEDMRNVIGLFLQVDVMSRMGHPTYTHILVDVHISKLLHGEVVLMVRDKTWSQLLDHEGLSFCSLCFFTTRHLALDYWLASQKGSATWWKDAKEDHLTIEASFVVVLDQVYIEHQVKGVLCPNIPIDLPDVSLEPPIIPSAKQGTSS